MQRRPLKLTRLQQDQDDTVEFCATSRRGENELDEALKKYSNGGANLKKMSAYETNMIFKTQPSPSQEMEMQVKVSPRLEINPKQLPFVMRDSMVMGGSPK
jgi:hypothetical protein